MIIPWIIDFKTSNGLDTILTINASKTIEDPLKEYVNKIRVPEEALGKKIIFLYNDKKLNSYSKEKIRKILRKHSSISVIDQSHLISLTIHFDTSAGLKTHMKLERIKTIEDMIKEYFNKIGVQESEIGKNIIKN